MKDKASVRKEQEIRIQE